MELSAVGSDGRREMMAWERSNREKRAAGGDRLFIFYFFLILKEKEKKNSI